MPKLEIFVCLAKYSQLFFLFFAICPRGEIEIVLCFSLRGPIGIREISCDEKKELFRVKVQSAVARFLFFYLLTRIILRVNDLIIYYCLDAGVTVGHCLFYVLVSAESSPKYLID